MNLKYIYQSLLPKSLRKIISSFRPRRKYKWISEDAIFFRDNKLIFIHIPKAAGISIYKGLFDRDSFGHVPLSVYQEKMTRYEFRSCYKFTFVRDPYDRLHSAYFYLMKGGRGRPYDLMYFEIIKSYSSFEDFVLNWLQKADISNIEHFCTQTSYLQDKKGKINVDYIGRFENLEEDYNKLCKNISRGKSLPFENRNTTYKNSNIFSDFTPRMIQIVNEIYRDDFFNFNYELK